MPDNEQKPADIEAIISGLYFIRGMLTPVDQIFSYINSELNKLIVAPFDSRKAVAISEQRLLYEEFGNNALHAWHAIQIWYESDLQLSPQWAFGVLAKSAKGITALDSTDRKINSDIKNVLKIDGNKIKKFKKNMFWLEVFHDVDALIKKGSTQTNAYLQVAEKYHGKAGTWRTVEKHYLDFRAKLDGVGFAHPFDP